MRPYHIYIFLLAAAMVFTGCKKGEEDPSVSLLSRKARLTGEWTVKNYEWKASGVDPHETYSEELVHHDEDLTGSMDMNTDNYKLSYNISGIVNTHVFHFDKDGTYWHKFYREMLFSAPDHSNEAIVEEFEKGTWSFLSKSRDTREKEVLALTPEQVTYIRTDNAGIRGEEETSPSNNESKRYRLIRLADDEIIMESERGTNTYTVGLGNENETDQTISETLSLSKN